MTTPVRPSPDRRSWRHDVGLKKRGLGLAPHRGLHEARTLSGSRLVPGKLSPIDRVTRGAQLVEDVSGPMRFWMRRSGRRCDPFRRTNAENWKSCPRIWRCDLMPSNHQAKRPLFTWP